MQNGGRRPGAGRPKGAKNKSTLDKEIARALVQKRVWEHLQPLVDAQIENAKGLSYLVARNKKTGKFERVTTAMLESRDAEFHETIEVWEKEPSVAAFADLLNRANDKPAEQMKVTGPDDGPVEHVFRWQK